METLNKNKEEIIKCCMCNQPIRGKEEHNARPIKEGRCCSRCNYQKVVPFRIKELMNKRKLEEEDE